MSVELKQAGSCALAKYSLVTGDWIYVWPFKVKQGCRLGLIVYDLISYYSDISFDLSFITPRFRHIHCEIEHYRTLVWGSKLPGKHVALGYLVVKPCYPRFSCFVTTHSRSRRRQKSRYYHIMTVAVSLTATGPKDSPKTPYYHKSASCRVGTRPVHLLTSTTRYKTTDVATSDGHSLLWANDGCHPAKLYGCTVPIRLI